ncbi:major facilitator superfamily protein [Catenovulum agarivorans DS-2]|uniref:Major facilitator superfamily protein n=1 Tax=Catenovulum agarivorans DS-2 TaxID=1328313 RepID=W7QX89_9ALTE|nr:MFS transporter [Catenovulum agarivorans]EWH09890.1 major facilitator superfamily protein [Catenovulum agarivorans DS-2]
MFANSTKARLSQIYFSYFTIIGVVSHYLGLYLDSLQLPATTIGSILAVMTIGRILGPSTWAHLSWLNKNTHLRIQLGCLFALLFFSLLLFKHNTLFIYLALGGFAFFWSAVLPQIETLTQAKLEGDASAYSLVRMWGSISFILFVIIAGWSFEHFGVTQSVEYMTMVLLVILLFNSVRLPQPQVKHSAVVSSSKLSFQKRLKQKHVVAFLVCSMLMQFSFAPYYGFFSIYMQDIGYTGYQTGMFISVGVVAEIVIFFYAGKLVKQFALNYLIAFCLALTALRWFTLNSFAEHVLLLILIQTIHAFSYGLFHVCAQKFMHNEFVGDALSKGQAFYLSVSFGIGGALGAWCAGWGWHLIYDATYYFAAAFALLGAVIGLQAKSIESSATTR